MAEGLELLYQIRLQHEGLQDRGLNASRVSVCNVDSMGLQQGMRGLFVLTCLAQQSK